ncbi:MAG: hypothetical protein ABR986_01360 [Methanomassiliicoccales archaeon]
MTAKRFNTNYTSNEPLIRPFKTSVMEIGITMISRIATRAMSLSLNTRSLLRF